MYYTHYFHPPSVIHSDMVYDPEYTTERTSNLVDCNFIIRMRNRDAQKHMFNFFKW